jgi:LruC domain-containing protein
LPWAINITDAFDYPIEKIEITQAHLHFYDWAVSSGVNYTNWYKNLQGYRNQNHIYLP